MVKKTMETISNTVGHINQHYDMSADNIKDIVEASLDDYDLVCNGFRLGYAQGMKAAMSEMRKAV